MRLGRRAYTTMLLLAMFLGGAASASGQSGSRKSCVDCHAATAKLATSPTAHQPVREGRCQWCHKPHGGANVNILHANGGRNLCVICHKTLRATDGERQNHRFEGKGECIACHAPHDSGRKALLRQVPKELCLSCHEDIKTRLGLAHP